MSTVCKAKIWHNQGDKIKCSEIVIQTLRFTDGDIKDTYNDTLRLSAVCRGFLQQSLCFSVFFFRVYCQRSNNFLILGLSVLGWVVTSLSTDSMIAGSVCFPFKVQKQWQTNSSPSKRKDWTKIEEMVIKICSNRKSNKTRTCQRQMTKIMNIGVVCNNLLM